MIYSKEDFKLAEEYVSVAIGMDKLFRESANDKESTFDKEGLLPIQLTNVQGKDFSSWEEVIYYLEKIEKAYIDLPDSSRVFYILQQINSTKKIAEWRSGSDFNYLEKVNQFLKVDEKPVHEAEIKQDLNKIGEYLSQKGFIQGSLVQRVKKWENLFLVENIKKVGDQYLVKAKNKLLQMGFHELEDVFVEMEVVYDVPYNAYCDYLNQKIYINGDLTYTSFHLKHLAVHEAFPGHTTHMTIREKLMKEERIPLDAGIVFTNTASSPVFEGIGDNGLRVLGWDQSVDDKIFLKLQALRSKVVLNAAYYLHVQKVSKSKVIDYLMKYGFGNREWASSRYRFISHYFRGTFIYAYWRGQESIANKMDELNPSQYVDFYRYILENMHSIDTLNFYLK